MFSYVFKLIPFRYVQYVMFLSISSTGDRIILVNDVQCFLTDLPCLPFNHYIIEATIVVGTILLQWSKMFCDGSEHVEGLIFLILLFKIIQHLIIGNEDLGSSLTHIQQEVDHVNNSILIFIKLFRYFNDIWSVEKLQFSFSLISSLQISLTLLALLVTFLKIACLQLSFTAYEKFADDLKMHCLLVLFSTF